MGFLYKRSGKGGTYFPRKSLKFVELDYNHHKMSQKHRVHEIIVFKSRILHYMKLLDHGLSPLLMQNPYSKFILTI